MTHFPGSRHDQPCHLRFPHGSRDPCDVAAVHALPSNPEIDYFFHFFPLDSIPNILAATNQHATATSAVHSVAPVTESDFWTFIALSLAMTMNEHRHRSDFWAESQDPLFPGPRFGQFVSRARFESIVHSLRLCHYTDADLKVRHYAAL